MDFGDDDDLDTFNFLLDDAPSQCLQKAGNAHLQDAFSIDAHVQDALSIDAHVQDVLMIDALEALSSDSFDFLISPKSEPSSSSSSPSTAKSEKKKYRYVCIHNRSKYQCKECGGSQICTHGRIRATCKICCGSQVCIEIACDKLFSSSGYIRCCANIAS